MLSCVQLAQGAVGRGFMSGLAFYALFEEEPRLFPSLFLSQMTERPPYILFLSFHLKIQFSFFASCRYHISRVFPHLSYAPVLTILKIIIKIYIYIYIRKRKKVKKISFLSMNNLV